ncbi:MAG TPA: DMT family transporter [Anaerolineales bacterium]|nr:DMT family transporter [Anaerolineales bacterium]
MTPLSLLLILGSACLHVVIHVALKKAQDRAAFVWWMLLWACILYLPILVLFGQSVPPVGWALLLLSSVFEASYFISIAKAYRGSDLSIVYPLARGTAPALLLIWSAAILREPVRPGGAAGIGLIALGLYLINLPRLGAWGEPLRALARPGPRWALLAGLSTSIYTAVDKVGIGYAPPLLYTYLAVCITTLWVTPITWREVGWQGLRRELRSSRLGTALAGFLTLAAYGIVLITMQMGTPASYAGAVREVSVVLGAAYGVLVLKEGGTRMRILGAVLVGGGVAMIALLG